MTSRATADGPDAARIPKHVAWTAGGTGRWMAEHGATADAVAAASDRALRALVEGALDLGVAWLTVALETADDIDQVAGRVSPWLATAGVALRLLGPAGARPAGSGGDGEERPRLVCTLASGYSGRAEVAEAIRRLAQEGMSPDAVDEEAIAARLSLPGTPDPDLLVRTGGDRRVPDLLLWSIAYSELVVLDEAWPEVGRRHLERAVAEYQRRDRRYGGLVASGQSR